MSEHPDPRAPWKLTAGGQVHAVFRSIRAGLWYWDEFGDEVVARLGGPLDLVDRYGRSILDDVVTLTRGEAERN